MDTKWETRKIQFTGKSSYIISLPKQWITEMGLGRGDQVRITRRGMKELRIHPGSDTSRDIQTQDALMEIKAEEEPEIVVRRLISLYFVGFKTINVRPRGSRLQPGQRTAIKKAVKRMLMGSEIISDSSDGITIQVMVNLLELSVDGAFKRMLHLARSMLTDAMLALEEENMELAREVVNTDDEVDKFGFYIIRQIKIAIQNEHMLETMGFKNARNCLGYRLVVKNIERTGDQAVFIARDMLEFQKGITADVLPRIKEMSSYAISVLDDACLALFLEDYILAEKTIKKTAGIAALESRILKSAMTIRDNEEAFRIRRLVENIRRISEYASDVAEIVLNINISKALKKAPRRERAVRELAAVPE